MDDDGRVEWREWGEGAFVEATERELPILLSLTATWCEPCREMDRETYAVPAIAAHVHDGFVPVRADVDRHPRVRDRYATGGFPSTVFLTPDGRTLAGAGYLGPDAMRGVLDRIREVWAESGADAGRIPQAIRDDEPPAGTLTPAIEAAMATRLQENHDEVAGGWGTAPKFPLPDAIEFALDRDRGMAQRSLEAVAANLFDEHEGGFFRFATEADWSGVHHEKLLDSNAALVRAFTNAYCYTGESRYREIAERTIGYLTTTLWNAEAGAFAASQAPGEIGSYTLSASDRESAAEPPVDRSVYAGPNGLAVEALATYAAYTDDERARRYAERALPFVHEELLDDGVVSHSPEGGDEAPLLRTQARVLRGSLAARSLLGIGDLEGACAIADATLDRLRDGESFVDGPPGPGLLDRPLRPIDANATLADGLLDLAILADEPRYREAARGCLEAFAGASDRFGPQVARYASVVARLLEGPLVVRVADPAGSTLHRGAVRVADHGKIVVPDDDGLPAGTARVERGGAVSELAESPAELTDRVGAILE